MKHNDLIYDVGMHKGEDTEVYLAKGFRVIAFEANPELVSAGREKFSKEITNGRVTIVEGAITDEHTTKINFFKNTNPEFGTLYSTWAERNKELYHRDSKVIEVNTVNFEECLKRFGIPHYLKIDIEGSDSICLKALLNFEDKPDFISIESEKIKFSKLIAELDLLIKNGYDKFKAVPQRGIVPEYSSGPFGEELSDTWKDYSQIVDEYHEIFIIYYLFGDFGKFKRNKELKDEFKSVVERPIKGWYDTHAKLRDKI